VSVTIVGTVLVALLYLFLLLLIGRLILETLQQFARSWRPRGVLLVLAEVTYTLTDPPVKLLRRVIPPVRVGTVALDLSFTVLFFVVVIAISVVRSLS
jgi:YggT family protein